MSAEELPSGPGLDADVSEQLLRLRLVTQMMGAIHEAQMLQLKMWPRVLFPCKEHAISYNSEERTLTITMVFGKDADLPGPEDVTKRIDTLESWCWWLLGPEWSVSLHYTFEGDDEGAVFTWSEGRRKAPLPGPARPTAEYGMRAMTEFKRYNKLDKAAAAAAVKEDLPPLLPEKT